MRLRACKRSEKLRRAFSLTAPYLHGVLPTEYTGMYYLDYGPQMSRGFLALKVWMTLKHYGAEGYRKLLAQNNKCVEYLDELVRGSDDFETFHKPNLFIYSFRYAPRKLKSNSALSELELENKLDELNQRIADSIQLSGVAFVMTSKVLGKIVLRLSVCSHRTTLADIKLVFEKLRDIGDSLVNEMKR